MSGTYNYWLVALSLVVASFASYAALDLATRLTAARGRPARYWLIGGAFSMGTGIWSMHFIGMLAFSLPVPMGYDVPVTLLCGYAPRSYVPAGNPDTTTSKPELVNWLP